MINKVINNMSVVSKIVIMLFFIIMIATTTVTAIRANQVNTQMQSLLKERLQNNTNMAVNVFDTVQVHTLGILNAIVNMPQNDATQQNLTALLEGINQAANVEIYANILLFDADLSLVAVADPGAEIPDLYTFFENAFMAQIGSAFVSPATESPQTGRTQFLFTQPIMENGNFVKIAAILLNTQALNTFMRDFIHDYDSFVNVADSSGVIFFSNQPAYIGRHVDDLGIYEEFGHIPFNTLFEHNSAITGIDKIAYVSLEPALGWTIVSFFDADAVESTARVVIASLLPTVSGIVIAAILVLIFIIQTLKPLKKLAAAANEVAEGNLDVDFNVDRNDEIGQVFHSFAVVVTALNALIEEAKSASRAKGNFLAKMSHEIRTPMNAIIGMAELILWEKLTPTAREQALTIKNSGSHLLTIINDILDFSKIESGKMEIVQAKYFFHPTIDDVISIINARLTNPNVQFDFYIDSGIPKILYGDEVRLRQILLNILSNAVKYTEKGTVALDIKWEKINEGTCHVIFKVKDTGIGIKSEDLGGLFNEFNQFDHEKNRDVEGTGLGLAITHNLVKLMGGDIVVESTYGLGTIFIVTLPQRYKLADLSQLEETILPNAAVKDAFQFRATNARVLVVDDVVANLQVAKDLMEQYGLRIDICESGEDSIELIRQNDYDLIFMDHMMPGMTGVEVVSILRDNENIKNCHIVALSASVIVGAREKFLQSGFDDFLSKPLEITRLHEVLMQWIHEEKWNLY